MNLYSITTFAIIFLCYFKMNTQNTPSLLGDLAETADGWSRLQIAEADNNKILTSTGGFRPEYFKSGKTLS